MMPAPPPDMPIPHPYIVDSLTVGERKQIADTGGNPGDWVGIRLPVSQLHPDQQAQVMIAGAALNRAILKTPAILVANPPPLYVGPSHLRLVLRRVDLGEQIGALPPAVEVEYRSVVCVKAGLEDVWPDPGAAWKVEGGALAGVVECSSTSTWLSEGEGWARAYRLAGELGASGFDVGQIRVDIVAR